MYTVYAAGGGCILCNMHFQVERVDFEMCIPNHSLRIWHVKVMFPVSKHMDKAYAFISVLVYQWILLGIMICKNGIIFN